MLEAKTMSYADALRGYLSHLREEKKMAIRISVLIRHEKHQASIAWSMLKYLFQSLQVALRVAG